MLYQLSYRGSSAGWVESVIQSNTTKGKVPRPEDQEHATYINFSIFHSSNPIVHFVHANLQPNHLVGLKRRFLQLKFRTVEDLMKAKR